MQISGFQKWFTLVIYNIKNKQKIPIFKLNKRFQNNGTIPAFRGCLESFYDKLSESKNRGSNRLENLQNKITINPKTQGSKCSEHYRNFSQLKYGYGNGLEVLKRIGRKGKNPKL